MLWWYALFLPLYCSSYTLLPSPARWSVGGFIRCPRRNVMVLVGGGTWRHRRNLKKKFFGHDTFSFMILRYGRTSKIPWWILVCFLLPMETKIPRKFSPGTDKLISHRTVIKSAMDGVVVLASCTYILSQVRSRVWMLAFSLPLLHLIYFAFLSKG